MSTANTIMSSFRSVFDSLLFSLEIEKNVSTDNVPSVSTDGMHEYAIQFLREYMEICYSRMSSGLQYRW